MACAVVTVSDSRTFETDRGGKLLQQLLLEAHHTVVTREIVPDEPARLRPLFLGLRDRQDVQAILVTGGTGISRRDQTYETVTELLDRTLPGYGELFRMLSYGQIGAAAMLSRAVGGVAKETVLLTMPGSPAAVQLAMEKIILPELAHLVYEALK